jgi:hypothetical protein
MKRAPVKHQQNKLIVMLLAGVGVALGGLGLLKHHTNQEAELMRKEVARLTKEQELAVKAAAEAATTRTSQVIGTGVPLRTTITTTTSTRTTRGSSNEAYQKRATEETRRREAEAARQRAAKAAMEELRRRVAEAERQRAAETAARGASSKANPAQKIAEAKAISEKAAAEKVQGTPFTAEAIAEREQSFNKFKKLLNTVTNDDYREFNRGRIIDHMREKGFNNWADLLKEHPGADFPGY